MLLKIRTVWESTYLYNGNRLEINLFVKWQQNRSQPIHWDHLHDIFFFAVVPDALGLNTKKNTILKLFESRTKFNYYLSASSSDFYNSVY